MLTRYEIYGFTSLYVFLCTMVHLRSTRAIQWHRKFFKTVAISSINFMFLVLYTAVYAYFNPFHDQLESFDWGVVKLAIAGLIAEVWFYWCHRLLHTPHLYRRIHKRHHEWNKPITWATFYCHPVENLLGNWLTLALPLYVCQFSWYWAYAWITLSLYYSILSHAGPVILWNYTLCSDHDLHHRVHNRQFGIGATMDWLFNTQ